MGAGGEADVVRVLDGHFVTGLLVESLESPHLLRRGVTEPKPSRDTEPAEPDHEPLTVLANLDGDCLHTPNNGGRVRNL